MTRRYTHISDCPARTAILAAVAMLLTAQPLDAASEGDDRYVVIKVKKAITITGDEISDAQIVIVNGKIEAVGRKVDYPKDSRVIDASNLIAMPGLINPHTAIGLPKLSRSGNQSHKKLTDAFYPPEDRTYARILASGYTLIGLYPPGSGLPGQLMVQSTHDPKEKSSLKDEGLVRVVFNRPGSDKRLLRETLKQARAEIEKESTATAPADQKQAPPASKPATASQPSTQPTTAPTTQPATKPASAPAGIAAPKQNEALLPWISLLQGKAGFMAHVEFARASDVVHFKDAIGDTLFARAYLFSGFEMADIYQVVDHELLGKAAATVALPPVLLNIPLSANPYNPARRLIDAGCNVVFIPVNDTIADHEQMRERLAFLVRNGLTREEALQGATLNAARFLDMDDEYGSIEKGKWADLIFLDGDPLDPTSHVRRVMIHGETVLTDKKKKGRSSR